MYYLLFVFCLIFVIYYSLFITVYLLFIIYYLSFFTCYLLFVIFYLLFFIYLFIHLLLSFCFPNEVCISHSSFKSKAARIQALRISGSEFRRTDIRCEVVSMHEYVMQASCCRAEVPIKG